MLKEFAGEPAAAAGGVRAADPRGGERAFDPVHGKIVEPQEFLGRALPVADVRLVPHLPVPRLDFLLAPPIDAVLH